ncbi:MAG: GNAT family N-acetyltransferase [Tissierellaceae bacterium]|nr:GNAT family N-acetyltransferase [Tissierellaceae bacterium]
MLIFRKYQNKDKDDIVKLLGQEGILDFNFGGTIYVAVEDEGLVGVGKGEKIKGKWYISNLVILKEKRGRGLGDALLRSVLNRINNQGAKWIYSKVNEKYLINKGFELNEIGELQLDMDEFFDQPCVGSCSCHV